MNKERKEEFREFKDEVNYEMKAGVYVFKKIFVGVLVLSIVIGGFSMVGKYVGANADRIIFKQTLTYNEGVLDDLAKYKLEMIQADDEVEKKAIANLVVDRFANYDESKIESYDLKVFLNDCRNLNVENY